MRILLRLDANHEIGLAHAIRVASILSLLKMPHSVIVAGDGEVLSTIFPFATVRDVAPANTDAFFRFINDTYPGMIIVDHPKPGNGFWRKLKNVAGDIPVIAIDDEGGDVDADLILNGTVLDEYHRYPSVRPSANVLTGARYALIRTVFGETPWQNPAEASVTIVVGSGDRARDWAFYLLSGEIDFSAWGQVRMIVGHAFPDIEDITRICEDRGVLLDSGVSGEVMARCLSTSSVALITGGMIVYEALAAGVPAVVFPQIRNLISEARWFSANGCILDLGYDGGMDGRLVSESVMGLLSSSAKRLAMSSAQRAVVDGRGMHRVAQAIDNILCDRDRMKDR